MKNAFSCLLAILCPFLNAICQPPARPLTVGDAVPDYLIRNLVNYKTPTARLSDFKEKLLILDFMATTCSGCVYNLFRFDTLESHYGSRVQMLPVSYESKQRLQSFLQKPFFGRKVVSPFVAQDTVLKSWFPYQFISHLVWIYRGRVVAITKSEYVNAVNIETVLQKGTINLPVKRDIGRYDPANPLFAPNPNAVVPSNFSALQYYSVVPSYLEGFGQDVGLYWDSINSIQRYYTINQSIFQLYFRAYGKRIKFPVSCILLKVPDTSRFIFNGKGYYYNWELQNSFCYEATHPLNTSLPAMQKRMQADLDFYLGLQSSLEKRRIRCMVLQPAAGAALLSAPPSNLIIEVRGLAQRLSQVYTNPFFVDEVPGSNSLYVENPASLTDLPALKVIFLRHGVEMIEEEREIEVLVITDKKFLP